MKKAVFLLSVCLMAMLTACGGQPEPEADLVFVNDSDAVIVEVVVDFVDRGGGARYANCKPLKRGETFGFEAGQYPVTVTVYDEPFQSFEQQELARLTIPEAPSEGEHWYVTAYDGTEGLTLLADTGRQTGSGGKEDW